ncbi:hypothetical protein Hanom_Chr00s034491g01771511 [Helianthus anomalus]
MVYILILIWGFHSVSFYLTVGDVEMVPVMVNTIKMVFFFLA